MLTRLTPQIKSEHAWTEYEDVWTTWNDPRTVRDEIRTTWDDPTLCNNNDKDSQKDLVSPVGANLRTSDDFVSNPIIKTTSNDKKLYVCVFHS